MVNRKLSTDKVTPTSIFVTSFYNFYRMKYFSEQLFTHIFLLSFILQNVLSKDRYCIDIGNQIFFLTLYQSNSFLSFSIRILILYLLLFLFYYFSFIISLLLFLFFPFSFFSLSILHFFFINLCLSLFLSLFLSFSIRVVFLFFPIYV